MPAARRADADDEAEVHRGAVAAPRWRLDYSGLRVTRQLLHNACGVAAVQN
jgi:hypothetical protein